MPKKTANGKYTYNKVYYDKPLYKWISEVHIHLSLLYGWNYYRLKPGAYGYDNLAHSLSWVFIKCDGSEDLDTIADFIHRGWVVNYLYWKKNEPWKTNKEYIKPANELGDKRRDNCAKTLYINLPDDEKKKNIDIAKYIIKNIEKKSK